MENSREKSEKKQSSFSGSHHSVKSLKSEGGEELKLYEELKNITEEGFGFNIY